jgi:hypothetical protein
MKSVPAGTVRALAAAIIAAASMGLGQMGAPMSARAAAPDLTFVTAATYEVLPDEGRVAVTVRITATNHLRDTVTRRYFFEEGYLSVLPGTSNFALAAASGTPRVTVASRGETGVLLRLRFGSRLASGESMDLTLTFDLPDPGGAPDRPLRISPSIVAFQAWAFATAATPGSSVEVRIPGGYAVVVGRGPLGGPAMEAPGWQVFSSGPLDAPLTYVADVTADRPGELLGVPRSTSVGDATVIVVPRAWPDDDAWRARVADLVLAGLPALGAEIGLPWPLEGRLVIEETLARGSGGYAGAFDPAAMAMEVGFAASPAVILHEAAHGWFNGLLVGDRWIAEAFASYYAERAAQALGVTIASPELADAPAPAALPLNAWNPSGEGLTDADAYGYAASLALAREIEALIGDEALRAVWQAAASGEPAYQPIGANAAAGPDTGAAPPDWRALLDLLEDRADPAATPALERLWLRWVTRPADARLLVPRASARAAYEAIVVAAAPWALPDSIRIAMRNWQFDAALGLLADAEAVLSQRDAVAAAAAAAGLTRPDALRVAFEGEAGLSAAMAEAATEIAVIGRISEAATARIAEPDLAAHVGLIGADPEADIAAARAAFAEGDLDGAIAHADRAGSAWTAVPELARRRIISAALLTLAGLLLVAVIVQRLRRQRVSRA